MGLIHTIIGAGQAAAWAAVTMRQSGFTGRIVVIGDEPYRPYERPPLSKAVLTAPALPGPQYFHAESRHRELDIEFLLETRAEEIEPSEGRIRTSSGGTLPFDKLLIATGGRARRLRVPGAEHALMLRTHDEARRLRDALTNASRVICIGAGVIGLEIASSARARGADVIVLEAAGGPMGRCVSMEGASYIGRLHRDAGVDLRYGVTVDAIARTGNVFTVVCGDTQFEGDIVVAAIGMERNDELARAAGIETSNGILVDANGQSSAAGIFAAGDVAAFLNPALDKHLRLESWQHAQNHGIAVARAMCGAAAAYDDIPWFWTDQHGVNLQVLGLPGEAARTVVRPPTDTSPFTAVHLSPDDTIVGITAANNPRDIRAGKSLMRQNAKADPALLADPSIPLQKVAVAPH